MDLETILGALEAAQRAAAAPPPSATPIVRDSERYFFSIFGTPSAKDTWGWRVEGHHVSLHFTVVNGTLVAGSPSFFGSNPAEVREGPKKGAADPRRGRRRGARAAAVARRVAEDDRHHQRDGARRHVDDEPPEDRSAVADRHRRVGAERQTARAADEADRRLHRLHGAGHRRRSRRTGCRRPASRRSGSRGRARPSAARSTTTGFRGRRSWSSTTTPRTTATTSTRCGATSTATFGRDLLREHLKSFAH